MSGTDVGPGMCLIDQWIRQNSKKRFDEKGKIAKSGKVNKKVFYQLVEKFNKPSIVNPQAKGTYLAKPVTKKPKTINKRIPNFGLLKIAYTIPTVIIKPIQPTKPIIPVLTNSILITKVSTNIKSSK